MPVALRPPAIQGARHRVVQLSGVHLLRQYPPPVALAERVMRQSATGIINADRDAGALEHGGRIYRRPCKCASPIRESPTYRVAEGAIFRVIHSPLGRRYFCDVYVRRRKRPSFDGIKGCSVRLMSKVEPCRRNVGPKRLALQSASRAARGRLGLRRSYEALVGR
jgi:hypothetical protein